VRLSSNKHVHLTTERSTKRCPSRCLLINSFAADTPGLSRGEEPRPPLLMSINMGRPAIPPWPERDGPLAGDLWST